MTAQEYADKLEALIADAVADGHPIYINNDCCGCSRMELRVALTPDSDVSDDLEVEV